MRMCQPALPTLTRKQILFHLTNPYTLLSPQPSGSLQWVSNHALKHCPSQGSGGMAGLERKDRPICRTQEPGVHKAIHAISMDVQPRCLSNVPGAKWASLSPQNETQFPLAIREMLRGRLVSEGAPPCWVSVLVSCCSSAGHQCCTSGVTIRPHCPPHPSDSHFATF